MPAVVVELGFLTHPDEGRVIVSEDCTVAVIDAFIEAIEVFDEGFLEAADALTGE